MEDVRLEDMKTIKEVFDSFGVRLILVYGALLGHYRDGDFLPGDDDVDFAVIDPIDLKTRKAIGWMLHDLGFVSQPIMFNVFGRMEEVEQGYNGDETSGSIVCKRNFKFTFFFFKKEACAKHGEEYVCIPKLGAMKLIATPARFYDILGTIKIGKMKFETPFPQKDYLAFSYFDNWKDKKDRRHSPTFNQDHETT